jgi:exosortase
MALSVAGQQRLAVPGMGAWSKSGIFAVLGLLAMVIPTIITMGRDYWSTEDGVHGPIILATGLWLIWRERKWLLAEARPLRGWWWAVPMALLGLLWVFARIFGVQSVESLSLYLLLVLAGVVYFGPAAMRRMWFPVIYMAFLIVPPGSMIVDLTNPMKIWISSAAVEVLHWLRYPVAHTGAIIQVGQYQLLVATACAGLMSLFSLTAIGLLYVHLSWDSNVRRAIILLIAIVPIAVFANFVRVIALVLLTYHGGSSVAQGIMHDMAGLITFSISLAMMFATDKLLSLFFSGREARA